MNGTAASETMPLVPQPFKALQPPSQTPYKIMHVAQGALSLGVFGFCMYEAITQRSIVAIVGAAGSLVSVVTAAIGFKNANACQNAFDRNENPIPGRDDLPNLAEEGRVDKSQGIQEFESQIRKLQGQLEEKQRTTLTLEAELERLRGLVGSQGQQKLQADTEKAKLEARQDELQGQVDDLKKTAGEKEKILEQLRNQIKSDADEKNQRMSKEKAELEVRVSQLQSQLDEQKRLVSAKSGELDSLRRQMEAVTLREKQAIKEAKVEFEDQKNMLDKQLAEEKKNIGLLNAQISDLMEQIHNLEECLEEKEKELDVERKLHAITKEDLQGKDEQIGELKRLQQGQDPDTSTDASKSNVSVSSSAASPIRKNSRYSTGGDGFDSE